MLEDGFENLNQILTEVGSRLGSDVTQEITKSGKKLNSGQYSSKQQRNIVRDLAVHLQEYGAFIKPSNTKYRNLLNEIESSLESLLGGEFDLEEDGENGLQNFIDLLNGLEESAFDGRQGFVFLIETMDALPKIEKSFNRAKVFMATELREFVANIDQTIAVISRAARLAKSLLEKTHNKQVNKDPPH